MSLLGRFRRRPAPPDRRGDGLPEYGFMGGHGIDNLRIPLDAPITGLRLVNPADYAGILDSLGFDLVTDGQPLTLPDGARHSSSSVGASDTWTDPADRTTRRRFQTQRDRGAWWRLDLPEPLRVDQLVLYGRRNNLTLRTRRVSVEVRDQDGEWQLAWSGATHDAPALDAVLADWMDADDRRERPVSALAAALRTRELPTDRERLRLIAALISIGTPKSHPVLTEAEWTVLTHLLCAQRAVASTTPSSVRIFGLGLDSRAKLDRLARSIEEVRPRYGLRPQVITRHGLRDDGSLAARGDELLDHVQDVTVAFGELGHDLMLFYGTLLGAVREGGFLAHDDDVDLAFTLPDPTVEGEGEERDRRLAAERRARVREVGTHLEALGWRVWYNPSRTAFNIHVKHPRHELSVDVFPLFVDGDVTHLHMHSMAMGSVPTDVLTPAVPFRFLERDLLAPAQPEAFLTARYGAGWRVRDPWHDWTWELSDEPPA